MKSLRSVLVFIAVIAVSIYALSGCSQTPQAPKPSTNAEKKEK
jgi:hypothetical protein